ncbi:MAG: glycosyltransferase, partial [Elioraea sp.]|nr:glycosyltransferase [Elioraea sp.]
MPRSALLVTYSLEMGGTQRASVFLAEVLASAGWRVSLFVCADRQRHVAPPASVVLLEGWRAKRRWRCLGLAGRSLGQAVALRRALRSERPDVIIALGNTPGLLALAATMGAAAPVVVADRVAPSQDTVERGLWRLAVRALYPRAARLVAPSQGILRERAWLADTAKVVIPNAVWLATDATSDGVALAPADAPHVVALGRLHPQKGFDLLVQAFAQLATKHPGWHLTIFGEGPERNRLEALAAGFGLRSRVHLPGAIRAPAAVLHRAAQLGGIFAFPS